VNGWCGWFWTTRDGRSSDGLRSCRSRPRSPSRPPTRLRGRLIRHPRMGRMVQQPQTVDAEIRHLRILGDNVWPIGPTCVLPASLAARQDAVNGYDDGCAWRSTLNSVALHCAPFAVAVQGSKCATGLHARTASRAHVSGTAADVPHEQRSAFVKRKRTAECRLVSLRGLSGYAKERLRFQSCRPRSRQSARGLEPAFYHCRSELLLPAQSGQFRLSHNLRALGP
jgi:hypothetical protein